MKTALLLSRSAGCLVALLALAAMTACHHGGRHEVSLDREALLAQASRQNRLCVDDNIVAQTPPRIDPQGGRHPSTFLFSAVLGNNRSVTAVGPFYLRMTVTGGGHTESSPPPRVELPAATRIRPGRTFRTPVLVTIPAVDWQPYTVDIRLWGRGDPDGGDNSYCQHRTFTIPPGGPLPSG